MSRLLVVTRASLAPGFRLAGVDAFGVEDPESAMEIISGWLEAGEEGLLAIDDGLYDNMEASFLKKLEAAKNLPCLVIPGGQPLGPEASRKYRIAEMIRRAIGFHITFKDSGVEE
ncbi:MAG: hypothetical protein OEY93_10945 [Anaerolineae bacterium]|nr:hypothetical protein [Anaerolineae bacterium]